LQKSPLVDAGNGAAITASTTTDQRGLLRIVGTKIDIGADEFQPGGTSTALTVSTSPAVFGQSITLTATVTATGTAPNNTPTGTVTFFNGTTSLGSATLNASGVATLTLAAQPPGALSITANYGGDKHFRGSVSAAAAVQVNVQETNGVFDPSTATWYLRNSNSPGAPDITPFQYGGSGWVGLTGNFGGKGLDSIAVVDPATETWYIKFSNGPGAPSIAPFQYGAPGWIPLAGDWTGSGTDTIAVVDPSTETWYVKNSNGAGPPSFAPFQFGAPGWIPVVGDWTGSGHDGIGVFDPTTATWYLRTEVGPGTPDAGKFQFGGAGWKPVPGEWGANGKTTVAVFDPTGTWYIKFSNASGAPDITPYSYGVGAWTPRAGNWKVATGQLQLAQGQGPGAAPLSTATLQNVVQSALQLLRAEGIDPTVVQLLASANYQVAALPAGMLGVTYTDTASVLISADAAGNGWFMDASAQSNAEFVNDQALPGTAAAGHADLLTTVLHEMGHLVGRPDVTNSFNPYDLMDQVLPNGMRRLDALDQVFAASASPSGLSF
jgi:hypothetical protein